MSNEFDDVVENIKQGSTWLRVLFILGFFIILYVAGVVLVFLILAQVLFNLIGGSDNENLKQLGSSLIVYVSQILSYQTFNSDLRPFPFAPFPNTGEEDIDAPESGSEEPPESPPVARKKPPAKKKSSATNKAPAKKKASTAKKAEDDKDNG